MTNTYAINTTRGREFEVEDELRAAGLHPWVPRRLESRYIKEKREAVWYDRPYVGKLVFCVIPAIYWRDVFKMKYVIGKPYNLSRLDIEGIPGHYKRSGGGWVPPVPGLRQFKDAVEAEYADAKRKQANSEYQCQYRPGQALEILEGAFSSQPAEFMEVIRRAHDDYARLRLELEMFGRKTSVEVDPDKVRAI